MSRQPLRTIPIFYDPEGQNGVMKDTEKPAAKPTVLRATSTPSSNTATGKVRSRSRTDVSAGKPGLSSKVRSSETAVGRIPFTIFEDESSATKSSKTPSSSKVVSSGRPRFCIGNSGEKTPSNVPRSSGKITSKPVISSHQKRTEEKDWKKLAEERRLALEQVLLENEMLCGILKTYEEENAQLSKIAQEAEFFAQVVDELTERERAEIVHMGTQTEPDESNL